MSDTPSSRPYNVHSDVARAARKMMDPSSTLFRFYSIVFLIVAALGAATLLVNVFFIPNVSLLSKIFSALSMVFFAYLGRTGLRRSNEARAARREAAGGGGEGEEEGLMRL